MGVHQPRHDEAVCPIDDPAAVCNHAGVDLADRGDKTVFDQDIA